MYIVLLTTMNDELVSASDSTPKFTLKGVKVDAKCVQIHDGDTAHFVFKPFPSLPLYRFVCRMFGYNSAEINGKTVEERAKANDSKNALIQRILGKIVSLHIGDFDKYGRLLVEVYDGDESVNKWMIDNGYGVVYYGEGEKLW